MPENIGKQLSEEPMPIPSAILDRRTFLHRAAEYTTAGVLLALAGVTTYTPDESTADDAPARVPSNDRLIQDVAQEQFAVTEATLTPSATPDLQATDTAADIRLKTLQADKQQTDNTYATVGDIMTNIVGPTATGLGIFATGGTIAYTILKGQSDRRVERAKSDESRFQEAVLALGKTDTGFAAATTLRTFLQGESQDYARFYQQIFDLLVGNLRTREGNEEIQVVTNNQELMHVFIEVVPLLRKKLQLESLAEKNPKEFDRVRRKYFDASLIRLDYIDLFSADLQYLILHGVSFAEADLTDANLAHADLENASPEAASSLMGTIMQDVENYSDIQKRQACKAKGAKII